MAETPADQINWDWHGKAFLKMNPKKHNHLITLAHDILPATTWHNKFDRRHKTCQLCLCMQEGSDHISHTMFTSNQGGVETANAQFG